ncbi:MAG: peptidoglycan D,D-transpeptidase FtsI family protein, partial [Brevinematia bacterium]
TSYKTLSIWANPQTLSEIEKRYLTKLLENLLPNQKEKILNKFNEKSSFVWISRKIPESQFGLINEITNNFYSKFGKKGIFLIEEYVRRYPLGQVASPVIGSVDIDNRGLSGIEYSFDDILLEKNNESGKIYLTIDRYIQEITYTELEKNVKALEADLGIAIFAKKDGEILAIADYPSYDPNDLKSIPINSKAVSYIFEPGSVMKLASASLALKRDPEILNKYFRCDGEIEIFNHKIKEAPHGDVKIGDIIAYSCNVGMLKIASEFQDNDLFFFLRTLGFGDKTYIGIPGEEKGILRPYNEWSLLSKYMISIGQEIGVTAIQLLKMGLIIANDGRKVNPKLVKKIILPSGNKKDIFYEEGKEIIPQEIAKKIKEFSRRTVIYGTGKLAEIENIEIGGKTGTGQIYNPSGGYHKDQYNSVFLGFVPYNNPQLIGIVVIINPKKSKQGGQSAAPTFREILKKILAYQPSIIQTQ